MDITPDLPLILAVKVVCIPFLNDKSQRDVLSVPQIRLSVGYRHRRLVHCVFRCLMVSSTSCPRAFLGQVLISMTGPIGNKRQEV
jgi:hypothetical protein